MKPPVPELGKPVLLPQNTPIVLAPIDGKDHPGCFPPGSICPTYPVDQLQSTAGFHHVHLLVFKVESAKKQKVDLRIEIATGDYANLLFMTEKRTVPVDAGTSILVGLDLQAAKEAQRFFVSGNTVTLSVYTKDAGVTVGVGKKSTGSFLFRETP